MTVNDIKALHLKLLCLFAEFVSLLEQLQERTLPMVALLQLSLQLLSLRLVQLVVVIQLVEVVHQFLVALDSQLCLHLLHVLDLFLVASKLLLHLLHHFVS